MDGGFLLFQIYHNVFWIFSIFPSLRATHQCLPNTDCRVVLSTQPHYSISFLLKFSLKKCLEYWECLQSHAVYFDQHNLFLHCRQERKRDQKKRIFVLSQLLSNVKQKGEINSHPSHEKQQQDELNWEDGHCSS